MLSTVEQRAILDLDYRVSQFRARTDIVVPGQHVEYACLVATGVAARFDQMRNGQRQITAFHIPGDMCDLHSVVAPTAAWGISALSACTILQVPHASLCAVIDRYPKLSLVFWRDGTADSSVLAKWLGNLGRQNARARLAHMLCELGVRMEIAGLGSRHSFEMAISQEQLADATGLTPVHVNRSLQRLRGEGLIGAQSHRFEILEWDRLVAAAEFDPAYLLLRDSDHPVRSGMSQTAGAMAG